MWLLLTRVRLKQRKNAKFHNAGPKSGAPQQWLSGFRARSRTIHVADQRGQLWAAAERLAKLKDGRSIMIFET
jgi:hypothetical protein